MEEKPEDGIRQNPGNLRFFKMKDTNRLCWVCDPLFEPLRIGGTEEFSFDQKTIYTFSRTQYYNLPPDLRKIFDEEEPSTVVRIIGWENASPELRAAARAQIKEWAAEDKEEDDEDEYDESEDEE